MGVGGRKILGLGFSHPKILAPYAVRHNEKLVSSGEPLDSSVSLIDHLVVGI